jgi:hypothetical protein
MTKAFPWQEALNFLNRAPMVLSSDGYPFATIAHPLSSADDDVPWRNGSQRCGSGAPAATRLSHPAIRHHA